LTLGCQQLLKYFGETNISPCGICSVCITKTKKGLTDSQKNGIEIVISILQNNELTSRELLEQSTLTEKELTNTIKLLLERKAITLTNYNTYKLA